MTDDYNDIMDMPRHVSQTRPRMTAAERAAQFSSFAALAGYEDAVMETERVYQGLKNPDIDISLYEGFSG